MRGGSAVAVLCLAVAALAQASPRLSPSSAETVFAAGEAKVRTELLVDASTVAPGDRVRVGVRFTMDPGWHIYWRNSGDSGRPTALTWRTGGAELGPTAWPAPRVFREAGGALLTYGYDGDVLLTHEAVVPGDARGAWPIEVDVDLVACEFECIPGSTQLARTVEVAASTTPADRAIRDRFELAETRVPRPGDDLGVSIASRISQRAVRPGDTFRVALEVSSCEDGDTDCIPWSLAASRADETFFPASGTDPRLVPVGLGSAPATFGAFTLLVEGRAWDDPGVDVEPVRGVLPLVRDGRVVPVAVEFDLPRARAEAPVGLARSDRFEVVNPLAAATNDDGHGERASPSAAGVSLGAALLLALLGGLVLNLMPCVLPVLALKVFGIAELAHAERGRVVQSGLAYLAGVLVSMAVLAATVIGLREAGTAVGWGFQLQAPIFVAAISSLLVLFALNLFGVFEITFQPAGPGVATEGDAHSSRRSFLEGALAVVLATPCTAPFLGTAVGFAFASSSAVILGIFVAIGVGLAAPYVLITLVPGWARLVPRPGPWMLHLRTGLGFALLATAVWLSWVAGRTTGVDGQTLLVVHLLTIAFLAWIGGVFQAKSRRGPARGMAVLTLAATVTGLTLLPLEPTPVTGASATTTRDASGIDWRPWDPAEIERERAAGHPVFVDFTADWCITCKVNETVVLSDDAIADALELGGFVSFKADWTRYDEAIREELAAHGRAGVPMYLVYPRGGTGEAKLLSELLTLDTTLEALRSAADRSI